MEQGFGASGFVPVRVPAQVLQGGGPVQVVEGTFGEDAFHRPQAGEVLSGLVEAEFVEVVVQAGAQVFPIGAQYVAGGGRGLVPAEVLGAVSEIEASADGLDQVQQGFVVCVHGGGVLSIGWGALLGGRSCQDCWRPVPVRWPGRRND